MDVSLLFNPGIYKITCLKNNKVYIGQSNNLLVRLGRHAEKLQANHHDCQKLQEDFNLYGKENFVFVVVAAGSEFHKPGFRRQYEQQLIEQVGLDFLYNKPSNNSTNYVVQQVKRKNQVYPSLREAARILKESRTHMSRKCKDPQNQEYEFVLLEEDAAPRSTTLPRENI